SEVVNELAEVHLDTRAILLNVTNVLRRVREGTWVATLLDKDPATGQIIAVNLASPEFAEYINRQAANQTTPGHAPTNGIDQQIIESARPLLLRNMPVAKLQELNGPEVQAYAAEHPMPMPVDTANLLAVPDYRLAVDDSLSSNSATSARTETVTALSAFSQFRRRSLSARQGFKAHGAVPLITRGKLLGALGVYHRTQLAPVQEWVDFLD